MKVGSQEASLPPDKTSRKMRNRILTSFPCVLLVDFQILYLHTNSDNLPIQKSYQNKEFVNNFLTLCYPSKRMNTHNNHRKDMLKTGDIALFEPEIAVNTGNIIRLSAGLGARLHLIHPLGFQLEEKGLRRAGLDYHDCAHIIHHDNFESFIEHMTLPIVALTTKGSKCLFQAKLSEPCCLLFGPETRGLPNFILESPKIKQRVKIPQVATHRSLNLSNAVAISAYEHARQLSSFSSFD